MKNLILMTTENYFTKKHEIITASKCRTLEPVKFIHASDIHLGATQYQNEHRANDFILAFKQILEQAIKHHVDFILLAGDIFTSLEMLPGLLTTIVNILKDFKKITNNSILIITIEGNHDIRRFSRGVRFERRDQSWLKLLNSIGLIILLDADLNAPIEEIFKPYDFETKQGGKIQIKDIVVYGTHYLGENPIFFLTKIRKALIKKKGLFLFYHINTENSNNNHQNS